MVVSLMLDRAKHLSSCGPHPSALHSLQQQAAAQAAAAGGLVMLLPLLGDALLSVSPASCRAAEARSSL